MSPVRSASGTTTKPGSRQAPAVSLSPDGLPTAALIERWQDQQDESARDVLMQRYMPLTRKLARRFQGSWEIFDDLWQVACIGLVNAINRFDTSRGVSFESFAIPTILGELKRYLRDSGWAVHVPRTLQERAVKVEQARRELAAASGRTPSYQELAQYLELSVEDVLEAVEASAAHHATSLETPRGDEDGEGTITLGDTIASVEENFDRVEAATSLGLAASHLSERERRVLALRFAGDLTQSEIAEQIGISQMQVSRILRRSLSKLEAMMRSSAPHGA